MRINFAKKIYTPTSPKLYSHLLSNSIDNLENSDFTAFTEYSPRHRFRNNEVFIGRKKKQILDYYSIQYSDHFYSYYTNLAKPKYFKDCRPFI